MADQTQSRQALTLESKLASIAVIEDHALACARSCGFDDDTSSNLAMVVREAAANAILHGNRSDPHKRVTASFEITSHSLIIQVADQGEGLDPASIPDPLAPENLMRPSGRGVFLMRSFMDRVDFRQLSPGTEITLVKHRPRPTQG